MKVRIDIGIACSGNQSPKWWSPVFSRIIAELQSGCEFEIGQILTLTSALPDHNKNNMIGIGIASKEEKRRNDLTDANRAAMSNMFYQGDESGKQAEWLMQIDDDTVFPLGTITRLLRLKKDFVAGVYFNGNPPFNPIAYRKDPSGFGYQAIYDYPAGSLIPIDSVGMGCTLIHRSVFERIMEGHELIQRPNGTLMPILKSKIGSVNPLFQRGQTKNSNEILAGDWYAMKVTRPTDDDNRPWPFYAMEYGRTEDHYFCELAMAVGINPWLDTTIECKHIKDRAYSYEDYQENLAQAKGLIINPYRESVSFGE